jgi:hypothetical protein
VERGGSGVLELLVEVNVQAVDEAAQFQRAGLRLLVGGADLDDHLGELGQ